MTLSPGRALVANHISTKQRWANSERPRAKVVRCGHTTPFGCSSLCARVA